ncbi:MAG: hypothetical protein ACYT04_85020, partial [Nostoc sp.]
FKTSICLSTKTANTRKPLAIDPTNLSLSAAAFSNGEIQPLCFPFWQEQLNAGIRNCEFIIVLPTARLH